MDTIPNSIGPSRIMGDNAAGHTAAVQVNTSGTDAGQSVDPRHGWREAGARSYVLLVVLWFLYLFEPVKFITYYVPAARPLSWIPELLLWACGIQWLRSSVPKRGYPAYTWFMVVMVFGFGVACVLGNWGVARDTIRVMYQYYLLGLITLSFCTTPERARPILGLYFGAFLWYGLWGLISLKTSPLSAAVDPGARVIIPWHPDFDNRDAFGPLMVAGLVYSAYYLQANHAVRTLAKTLSAVSSMGLTLLGFITSFGRGAFLGFLAAVICIWLRSRRKIAILVAVALGVGSFSFMAPQLAAKYLVTMQTITGEGMEAGTGADRAFLWGIAWREFLDSPIVGMGTDNYGPASGRVLGENEVGSAGYTRGRLWERVPHSAPMRILAEYGLIGSVIALVLIVDFFRTNRRTRIHAAGSSGAGSDRQQGFPPGYVQATALGLYAAFLAICVSSIFYELLYSSLLWNVIVLNRMLYFSSGADVVLQNSPAGR